MKLSKISHICALIIICVQHCDSLSWWLITVLNNLLSPLKIAFKVTYILHFLLPYVPFFHLPSVHPAPGYVVEKGDSMLEAGDVIKQSGKELCALPKDSKMFQVMNQLMNQIYWVNASLNSISPVNGMVHNVPLTDFDSFEIGEPAPPAPPSPPSIPIPTPQPGTSQTTTKERKATYAFGSEKQQMEA